jgi:hypothetical protein
VKQSAIETASAQANDRLVVLEQKLGGGDLVTRNDFAKMAKQNAHLSTRLDELDSLLMGGKIGDEVEALKKGQAGLQAALKVEMQAVGAVLGRQMRLTGAYGAITSSGSATGISTTGSEKSKTEDASMIDVIESGLDGIAQCAKCENDSISDEQVNLHVFSIWTCELVFISALLIRSLIFHQYQFYIIIAVLYSFKLIKSRFALPLSLFPTFFFETAHLGFRPSPPLPIVNFLAGIGSTGGL